MFYEEDEYTQEYTATSNGAGQVLPHQDPRSCLRPPMKRGCVDKLTSHRTRHRFYGISGNSGNAWFLTCQW